MNDVPGPTTHLALSSWSFHMITLLLQVPFSLLSFHFFFWQTGAGTQDLMCAKQGLYHLNHSSRPVFCVFCFVLFWFFCSTRVWTQGLHPEPLHQPFFCDRFFWDRDSWTIHPGLALNCHLPDFCLITGVVTSAQLHFPYCQFVDHFSFRLQHRCHFVHPGIFVDQPQPHLPIQHPFVVFYRTLLFYDRTLVWLYYICLIVLLYYWLLECKFHKPGLMSVLYCSLCV
jgi:hypothetical protein